MSAHPESETDFESESAKRKTILFFPLNSPGHINSSLGIADRLKATTRHRTVFLVLGPMIGNTIRDHGHELVTLQEVAPYEDYEILEEDDPCKPVDEELMRRLGRTKKPFAGVYKWPQILARLQRLLRLDPEDAFVECCENLEQVMTNEVTDNHENYAAAIKSIAPDLIVIDAYYVPPCVVLLKSIPWVRLYSANPIALLGPAMPDGTLPPPVGVKLYNRQERDRLRLEEPEKWATITQGWRKSCERMFAAMNKASSGYADWLAKHGCEPLGPGQQAHDSPHLNIYMFPRAIDYHQDDDLFKFPPRWVGLDSLLRKQETVAESEELRNWAQALGSRLVNKDAVVFFSLGTLASGMFDLMKHYVEMLSADKRRLYVISKGVNGDKYELSPDNMIGGNYIPQNYFLQRVDLAIVHGGNNSITECLYHGLPMIVLPVFADQLVNAQRIEDLGLGRRLNVYNCTQEELLKAIDDILQDQALLDRAREIGRQMQQRDDLSKAMNLLDKLLTVGTLSDEDLEKIRQE